MKPYLVTCTFYYDNERQSTHCITQLRDDPCEEEYSGTDFEGLWELTYGWEMMMPLVMLESKKGERYLQYTNGLFKKITPENCKPWRFVISSQETTITMARLMQFDTEKVIQYLKERGMTACPMNL